MKTREKWALEDGLYVPDKHPGQAPKRDREDTATSPAKAQPKKRATQEKVKWLCIARLPDQCESCGFPGCSGCHCRRRRQGASYGVQQFADSPATCCRSLSTRKRLLVSV